MTPQSINTAKAIIDTAMRHAGRLSEGQIPSSDQYANYSSDLLRLIQLWQTQGLKLWLQTDMEIPLVSGQNLYQLGPGGDINMIRPVRALQGYYLYQGVRRPIYPLSRDEWMRLSTVTQTGQISQYFIDKQQELLNVYFWLTPDYVAAQGSAHLLLQQQIGTPAALTDEMNFPAEWSIALVWGLADEISTGQPQTIMDRCQQRAAVYRTMLEDWDVEDASTSFSPDTQRGYRASSFQ